MRESYTKALEVVEVTIASGASLSTAVVMGGLRLSAIEMPSVWTTANMTFQASLDGGTTWCDMYDADANEITAKASASRNIPMLADAFLPVPMIRIRSGVSATPVNQEAARIVKLVLT